MTKYMKYQNGLIEQGLCPQCRKLKDREGYYCSECVEKHNSRRKEDSNFYVSIGLCRVCEKNKQIPGTTYCEDCSQRAYKYNKARYERDPEYVREHNRISSKKRYDECKAQGICVRCRKIKAISGKTKCGACLEADRLRHKYWYNKKKECING